MTISARPVGFLQRRRWRGPRLSLRLAFAPSPYLRHGSTNTSPSLEQTRALLPRILPEPGNQLGNTTPERRLDFWNKVLSGSSQPKELVLNSQWIISQLYRHSIDAFVVLPVDHWSPSRELVTALLRDVFASDASIDDQITARWTETSNGVHLIIRYAVALLSYHIRPKLLYLYVGRTRRLSTILPERFDVPRHFCSNFLYLSASENFPPLPALQIRTHS